LDKVDIEEYDNRIILAVSTLRRSEKPNAVSFPDFRIK